MDINLERSQNHNVTRWRGPLPCTRMWSRGTVIPKLPIWDLGHGLVAMQSNFGASFGVLEYMGCARVHGDGPQETARCIMFRTIKGFSHPRAHTSSLHIFPPLTLPTLQTRKRYRNGMFTPPKIPVLDVLARRVGKFCKQTFMNVTYLFLWNGT